MSVFLTNQMEKAASISFNNICLNIIEINRVFYFHSRKDVEPRDAAAVQNNSPEI